MYYVVLTVSTMSQRWGGCSEHASEHISSLFVLMESVVTIIRSCFSVLVFALLLCSVLPVDQVKGAADSVLCGSTGEAGHGQTCDFGETGAATESEDDSPQEMQDDYVTTGVSVSDCGLSRTHASMNQNPPSILLVSQLLHPPTAHS